MFRSPSGRGGARSYSWRVGRMSRRVLCALVILLVLLYFFWPHLVHHIIHMYHYWDCNNEDSKEYLDQLVSSSYDSLVCGTRLHIGAANQIVDLVWFRSRDLCYYINIYMYLIKPIELPTLKQHSPRLITKWRVWEQD